MTDLMTAAEFRQWRKDCGYSQARASMELGVDISTIKRYDAGRTPVSRTVRILCGLLLRDRRAELRKQAKVQPVPLPAA